MLEFYMTFARKINENPAFYTIFARKMPEFYITFARKFYRGFFWKGGNPCPVYYACGWAPGPPPAKSGRVPDYWLGLRQRVFTCVRWQVTLCVSK